jgi:hypothetical protein
MPDSSRYNNLGEHAPNFSLFGKGHVPSQILFRARAWSSFFSNFENNISKILRKKIKQILDVDDHIIPIL